MRRLLVLLALSSTVALGQTKLYVATNGNDAWSGTLAEPNAAGNDGPFATLLKAKMTIRKLKQAGLPDGGVTVYVREGVYSLTEPLQLGPDDSGTATAPIVYRSQPGEQVTLLGGKPVTGFKPYQGKILQADVAACGLKGVGFKQLVFNGERMTWARYPNIPPDNPLVGGYAAVDGRPVPMYGDRPDDVQDQLVYREEDARTWSNPAEGEVLIFARYNWYNNIVPIQSVDPATRTITLAKKASYAIRPTDRYYVQGLREELDAPGEWYLDRETSTLYFWPPEPLDDKPVYAPSLPNIVELNKAAFVTFRGFTLECCEGSAFSIKESNDCLVAGCTIRNVGDYSHQAVLVYQGERCGVVGNDIHHVGRDAISLTGGDRMTLTPGDHYADNNYLHHPGLDYKWGLGVYLIGCGLRASHNLIHDCPRAAVGYRGNLLVIEFNRLRHLCFNSEDAAGIGTGGRDWISSRGSIVRYNFISDVLGYGRHGGQWVSPFFAWGIYLDDNTGGVDVIGNIVTRCGRAGIHLHNARDIHVRNNIFVNNRDKQIECSGWTVKSGAWARHLPTMIKGWNSVKDQPAWQQMRGMDIYPEDAPLPSGMIMSGNVFERNIAVSWDEQSRVYRCGNVDPGYNQWDYNLLWAKGKPVQIDGLGNYPADEQYAAWRKSGEDRHSVVADPMFVDPEHDDFRLQPDSPALKLGFKPIPVDQIGPYQDELRASWPIVEAEGVREHPIKAIDLPPAPPRERPAPIAALRIKQTPKLDGHPTPEEWPGNGFQLADTPSRLPAKGKCTGWVAYDDANLYVAVRVNAPEVGLQLGHNWGAVDGAEVCLQAPGGPIYVLHSFLDGKLESVLDGGASAEAARKLQDQVGYGAVVTQRAWAAEWQIPLAALGVEPKPGTKLAFNLGVRRTDTNEWVCWAGTNGANWKVAEAGEVVLK